MDNVKPNPVVTEVTSIVNQYVSAVILGCGLLSAVLIFRYLFHMTVLS